MAYLINGDCIKCETCVDTCPVAAIGEKDGKLFIDTDLCLECGACVAACPQWAIEEK